MCEQLSLTIRALRSAGCLPGAGCLGQALGLPLTFELGLESRAAPLMLCQGLDSENLELFGLAPGLVIPLERRPFHRSPGRWHFLCPACGLRKGVLVKVPVDGPPVAVALGWSCRNCSRGMPMGTPPWSPAWPLTPDQRLKRALEKAANADYRQPGEERRRWRRRAQRASMALQRAAAQAEKEATRLTRRLAM